jgi:hypothetical protein
MPAGQLTANSQVSISDPVECAVPPAGTTLAEAIAAGCTTPTRLLTTSKGSEDLLNVLDSLGLFTAPSFPVETLSSSRPKTISDAFTYLSGDRADPVSGAMLRVSPLQMALAAASLSNEGELLNPRLAMAVENPQGGWVMLPVSGQTQPAGKTQVISNLAAAIADKDLLAWQVVSDTKKPAALQGTTGKASGYTWYLGGTLPEWKGATIAVALLLEEDNPQEALSIGHSMLQDALTP